MLANVSRGKLALRLLKERGRGDMAARTPRGPLLYDRQTQSNNLVLGHGATAFGQAESGITRLFLG